MELLIGQNNFSHPERRMEHSSNGIISLLTGMIRRAELLIASLKFAARQTAGLIASVRTAARPSVTPIPFISAVSTDEEKNLRAQRFMKVHGNSILRLAYSYLHNMEDSEDVLQDTLIRVLEANPVFESEDHEKAYLLRCAANVAKNRIEYNKYRETDELSEELVAEQREDLSFVWDAVKSLPEKEREVVHLFYAEGYRTAEIAELLDRNESTVRSDLKRARDRLKDILKEDYDFG